MPPYMLQTKNSMKNVVAVFALLLACGTGTVKSQNSLTSFKAIGGKQLQAFNFINNISFTPEAGNPLIHTTASLNTTEAIKPRAEISAQIDMEADIEKLTATQFKYAMLMDVEVEALTNTTLYSFIDDWYGTHYRMGGTNKKGIDCSAFSGTLLSSIYSFDMPRTAREQYKACQRVDKENLLAGDLVFFNTRGGVSHVGVYLTNNHFVHSSSSNGVTISSLADGYYSKKFIGGGRVNQ